MTEEKTTRELVYETNRDVKWICRALQRMEAQDLDFESRLRALEGWRAEKAGEELRVSTLGAGAGGVVGGVVAVIVRVLRRAGEGRSLFPSCRDLINRGRIPPAGTIQKGLNNSQCHNYFMHYIVTDGAGFIGSNLADKVATRTSNAPTLFHGNITSCTSYSSSCPATGRISHLAVLEPQSMGTSYQNSITAS